MAEKEAQAGAVGMVSAAVEKFRAGVAAAFEPLTRDGTLEAAWRQGADEMAVALKAFPDSIQMDEPGTIWSPTQGEIAEAREQKLPTPSEIAADNTPYTPRYGHGNDNDQGQSRER